MNTKLFFVDSAINWWELICIMHNKTEGEMVSNVKLFRILSLEYYQAFLFPVESCALSFLN